MKFIKTYKIIWIQCVVFLALGIYKRQIAFFILTGILFILPLISETGAKKYLQIFEFILNKTGYWIKNLLFFILYYTVFTSVAFIRNLTQKKTAELLTDRNKEFSPSDFEKMW